MIPPDLLARYCADPSRVSQWSGSDIGELGDAILFVLATWSGESLAALQKLTGQLQHSQLELYVVDNDELTPVLRALLAPLSGRGETFRVANGKVTGSIRDFCGQWARAVTELSEGAHAGSRR